MRIKKKKRGLIIFISILFLIMFNYFIFAEDEKVDVLIEMDLEQLLNMDITTVSKKSQSISEAPAIVTIITADKIEQLGVTTLTELMSYVPGFSVADTYWKRQIVTARGVKMTLYNDKILMLINGIPAYDAAAMEYFLDVIPITSVKRIEIIRGPGSTLYGTNAFSAVINVITKDKNDGKETKTFVNYGSFDTKSSGVSIVNHTKDFHYHIGVTMKDDDGYIKKNIKDEYGVINKIQYEHDNNNFYGYIQFKNFSIQGGFLDQKWSKFGPLPAFRFSNLNNVSSGGRTYHEKYYINSVYQANFSEKVSFKLYLHYDKTDQQADIGDFGVVIYKNTLHVVDTTITPDYYRFGGSLIQGEGQIGYNLSEKISFLGGICYETRKTEHLADLYTDRDGDLLYQGSTKKLPFNVSDFGGYIQVDGKLGKIGYVAGIRMSYLGISKKSYFTPRAGFVYNLPNTSFKLLYGEAFRGAGPQEQYYKVPMLIYGPDAIGKRLQPERIKTYEVAVDQKLFTRYKVKFNAFYINVFDMINRRPATSQEIQMINPNLTSTLIYDNLGNQNIKGFEIEFDGYPLDNLNVFADFSYKAGKNERDSINYIPFMENITSNCGLIFKTNKIDLTPSIQYVGEKKGILVTAPHNKISNPNKIEGYLLAHLNMIYKFNKNLSASLSIRNIFDKKYFYPEDVRKKIEFLPGGPGRSIFLKITWNAFGDKNI